MSRGLIPQRTHHGDTYYRTYDLDRQLTITYAMNKMENLGLGNERTIAYVGAVYRALGWAKAA
jgi:hypothetical protein